MYVILVRVSRTWLAVNHLEKDKEAAIAERDQLARSGQYGGVRIRYVDMTEDEHDDWKR